MTRARFGMVDERIEQRRGRHRQQLRRRFGADDELQPGEPVRVAAQRQQVDQCASGALSSDDVDPGDVGHGNRGRGVPQHPDQQLRRVLQRPGQGRVGPAGGLEHCPCSHVVEVVDRPGTQQRQTDLARRAITTPQERSELRDVVESHGRPRLTHHSIMTAWGLRITE